MISQNMIGANESPSVMDQQLSGRPHRPKSAAAAGICITPTSSVVHMTNDASK